jgi:DNA-binding CsgD family transcriptional regulator
LDARWPLVGRDAEREAVERTFAGAEHDAVVLAGSPGVGLTRLAQEARRWFAAPGRTVEWIPVLLSPRLVPYGPVMHLLPAHARPDTAPAVVLAAVARRFAKLGARDRAVIVVDDAHRLEPLSAGVLAHLVARSLAFVVATVRRGRPVPEEIAALMKDGVASRIDVESLPPDALDALLAHALPGQVDAITRRRLHRAALGRPGVLRDLLTGARADGTLTERHGVWRWHPPEISARHTAEIVASELTGYDRRVRAVLEIVALGEPLPAALLEQLADGPAIEAAERTGLLVVERTGARTQVRIATPGYAAGVRDRTPTMRSRRIAGRLARSLHATALRRATDLPRLAAWQRQAGAVIAPDLLVPAARQLLHSDPALAEWCARAALAAGDPQARLLLAQILAGQGRGPVSADLLGRSTPEALHRSAWVVAQAATYYWSAGRLDEARQTVAGAASVLGPGLTDALRAWILLFGGAEQAALDTARDVLHRSSPGEPATVWAAVAGTGAAGLLGMPDEALRLNAAGRAAIAARRDLAGALPYLECVTCAALLASGDLARAVQIAETGYAAAAADEAPLLLGVWALLCGMVARAAGRVVTAQGHLREALCLLGDTSTRLLTLCRAELAGAAALAGDLDAATGWLARTGRPTSAGPAIRPWQDRAAAWVLAARGSTTDAVAQLRAAAASAGPMAEAHLLYDVTRLGAPTQVRDRLGELARTLGGRLVPAYAAATTAYAGDPSERTANALAHAGRTFAGLGYALHAAEATLAAARTYRRLGHRSRAAMCREVAVELAGRCEGARTMLLSAGDLDAALTVRERQILLLAGTRTSRAIAAQLGVAVSTVNNHLASAYAKLGIAGRADLPDLLGPWPGAQER